MNDYMREGDTVPLHATGGFLSGTGVFPYQDAKQQRLHELYVFLNRCGNSGWVNTQPILQEIARLLELPEGAVRDITKI